MGYAIRTLNLARQPASDPHDQISDWLARVAEMPSEDQDWPDDISDELDPKDGKISVCRPAEEHSLPFAELGTWSAMQVNAPTYGVVAIACGAPQAASA